MPIFKKENKVQNSLKYLEFNTPWRNGGYYLKLRTKLPEDQLIDSNPLDKKSTLAWNRLQGKCVKERKQYIWGTFFALGT
jgi:hypothetical protein